MSYLLVCIAGPLRGSCWTVPETGLTLGRSGDCHITVAESSVSRRHCRIALVDGRLHYEDLGSRNPGLVNGHPATGQPMNPGDELALGQHLFVVTRVGYHPAEGDDDMALETAPWTDMGFDVHTAIEPPSIPAPRPRTVHDLAMLHAMTREFSACVSMAALLDTFGAWLHRLFEPVHYWITRTRTDEKPIVVKSHGTGLDGFEKGPGRILEAALRDLRGVLVPHVVQDASGTRHVTRMAVPVSLGGLRLGGIVVETETPHRAYQETDLNVLIQLAETLAPFIHAVENLEQLRLDNERLRVRAGESRTIVGESRAIRAVRTQLTRAAKSNLNVLILGETGTGKELAARMIHDESSRAKGPFAVVNCAAIPRELFESELFGYERGAFTGAQKRSDGLFYIANGGTLFLDEIGDLSLENQARILRAIEYGTFRRLGGKEEIRVDVRIVAATNLDVNAAIDSGTFRRDLYHRLSGFEVQLPSLRQRPSDIPILAEHFFRMAKSQAKRPLRGIAPEVMDYLQNRAWPGNVRELRYCIERAVNLARHDVIVEEDVIEHRSHGHTAPDDAVISLEALEKRHIAAVLQRCDGNVREAAKLLKIGRSTLYKKINDYGLTPMG